MNLNLLPILQMLLKTRAVSKTAMALGMSQPAVSDALSRLREVLNDQLLVRVGASMKLTPRAIDLIEPLELLCAELEHFLSKSTFDPKTAEREFVIATSDICAYLLARPMMDMLAAEAPRISLHLIDIGYDLTDRMAARQIDFALLPKFALDDLAPAPLRFKLALETKSVVLMRKGHPLAEQETISNADISRYRHVVFQPDAVIKDRNRLLELLDGAIIDAVARVGQILLVPHLLQGTDFISVVPKQLGDNIAGSSPVETRPLSYHVQENQIGLVWSPIYDSDLAHEWFRTTIVKYMN